MKLTKQITEEKTKLSAHYLFECFDKTGKLKWTGEFNNIIPTVGKNKLLDAALKTGLTTPLWYVGLKLVGTAVVGDTMASHASWAESAVYSNANRPTWTPGAVAAGAVDNSAAKAAFTINGSATITGGFVVDNNTKSGTTGTLLSVGDFGTSKAVENGDTLNVTVTFTVT